LFERERDYYWRSLRDGKFYKLLYLGSSKKDHYFEILDIAYHGLFPKLSREKIGEKLLIPIEKENTIYDELNKRIIDYLVYSILHHVGNYDDLYRMSEELSKYFEEFPEYYFQYIEQLIKIPYFKQSHKKYLQTHIDKG